MFALMCGSKEDLGIDHMIIEVILSTFFFVSSVLCGKC